MRAKNVLISDYTSSVAQLKGADQKRFRNPSAFLVTTKEPYET